MARKSYVGAAVKTTITAGLAASGETTIVLAAATGWPTVSGGSTGFVVVVDPGLATEEKILCTARTGTSCTIGTRGYDGTSATAHSSGAAIWHVLDANVIDEANAHVNDTTRDDHTQYLNNTRHDITARHAFGAALGSPGTPATVNTIASAGTAAMPARSDHVHTLDPNIAGAGLGISGNALTVNTDASTVEISGDTLQVVSGGITATQLATDAVGSDEIAAGAVTQAKLASGYRATYAGASAPGSPAEGDLWYETDTEVLWVYDGSAWIGVGGNDAWTAFTPDWINITEGNGTNLGAYQLRGKTLRFRASLTFGSSTSAAGVDQFIGLTIPASKTLVGVTGDWQVVTALVYDTTGPRLTTGTGYGAGGTTTISRFGGEGSTDPWDSNTPNSPWATGDILMVSGTVEVA